MCAEQARTRQRQLEAQLDKQARRLDTKLKCILGAGALAGNLVEHCLRHVSEAERALACGLLQEQATAKAEVKQQQLTDGPQNSEQE